VAKDVVAMRHAGPAWRGWFPLGGELTSGVADAKEGAYFGAELGPDDARVRAGTPLHGANLFPAEVPELRTAVLDHIVTMTALGQAILRGMALGLGLPAGWFAEHLTADPLVLFRMFRYPPQRVPAEGWGVAEHTDYGLLTLLLQDDAGGLEVGTAQGWVAVPPIPGSFVCNLGDMLERLTGGRYRSTPHRVRNATDQDRLSFPFFLDPGWDVEVHPLPLDVTGPAGPAPARWDEADVLALPAGTTYGQYLQAKVGRVFPGLR
jgi:isopenicillin N synthase-like dioxygenase